MTIPTHEEVEVLAANMKNAAIAFQNWRAPPSHSPALKRRRGDEKRSSRYSLRNSSRN